MSHPKDPDWDRRKEDADMRAEVLKTLGSVQSSITLFKGIIDGHKAETEERIQEIHETLADHARTLNGNSDTDGLNQQLREMRRSINVLMTGVLGEGGNYEKSLKGQVEAANKSLSQLQAAQLRQELAIESLENRRTQRITMRGQNFIVIASLCTLTGAILAAVINAFGPRVWQAGGRAWEKIKNPPRVEIPSGSPSPVPYWIRPKKAKRKSARRHVVAVPVKPAEENPAPAPQDPGPDPNVPTPAPTELP